MNRRAVLAAIAAAAVSPAWADTPRTRALSLYNTHTGETFSDAFVIDGAAVPDALRAIEHVLRDHRSGEVHQIDPALLAFLSDLQNEIGRPKASFDVISGYRSPATNATLQKTGSGVATRSLHMLGKAIDVRVRGLDTAALRDAAIGMSRGGVGYYGTSDFVHLDTGRVRRW